MAAFKLFRKFISRRQNHNLFFDICEIISLQGLVMQDGELVNGIEVAAKHIANGTLSRNGSN